MKSTRALQGKSAGKGKGRRNSCINILLKTNEKKRKTCIKYALILCLACFIPPKDVHVPLSTLSIHAEERKYLLKATIGTAD